MRPKRWWTWIALAAWLGAATGLSEPLPRPSSFYGRVAVGGSTVPTDTEIRAEIGGTSFAATTTIDVDGESTYRLDVPGDLPRFR